MPKQDLLLDLGHLGVERARAYGASEAEFYLVKGTSTSVDFRNNTIQSAQHQTISGIGSRAFRDKASGSVSTTSFSRDAVLEAA